MCLLLPPQSFGPYSEFEMIKIIIVWSFSNETALFFIKLNIVKIVWSGAKTYNPRHLLSELTLSPPTKVMLKVGLKHDYGRYDVIAVVI